MLNAAGEQTQDIEIKIQQQKKKRSEMNKARTRTPRARLKQTKGSLWKFPRAILRRSSFSFYVKSGGRHIRSWAPEEENYYFNVPNRFVLLWGPHSLSMLNKVRATLCGIYAFLPFSLLLPVLTKAGAGARGEHKQICLREYGAQTKTLLPRWYEKHQRAQSTQFTRQ